MVKKMSVQKCSGGLCEYRDICLHAIEGKKKTKIKGKWIVVDLCRDGIYSYPKKEYLKLPFTDLLLKET